MEVPRPGQPPVFWNHVPVIYVKGTHYEIGKCIGEVFKDKIQTYLKTSVALNKDFLPFTMMEEGKALVDKYEAKCSTLFPQYLDEVRGIAEGAQVNFRKLFTLTISNEITLILKKKGSDQFSQEGCTTILCRSGEMSYFSHNEDVPQECVSLCYLIVADISDLSHNSVEKWVSFANPGMIVGHTFGFNSHGLMYSVNDVIQEDADVAECAPRKFILRSLLAAKSINEVPKIFQEHAPVGAGFTTNYAQICGVTNNHRLVSMEFFRSSVNVREVDENETYCHANLYVERKEAQYPHPSSTIRRERFKIFSEGRQLSTPDDILSFLSDTENRQYPVFRDGTQADGLVTSTTVFFDLSKNTMSLYRGPPASKKPTLQLSLDRVFF